MADIVVRALLAASFLLAAACDGPRGAIADRMPEPILIPALERTGCDASSEQLREEVAQLRRRNLRLEMLVETLRREGTGRLQAAAD